MFQRSPACRAWFAIPLIGALAGAAHAQGEPAATAVPIVVEQSADPTLRILGVNATAADGRLVVTGRVTRGLRTSIIGSRTLQVELLAADGSVRSSEALRLSANDLARRSTRDAHFSIELDQLPAAGESLMVVMNPRRG